MSAFVSTAPMWSKKNHQLFQVYPSNAVCICPLQQLAQYQWLSPPPPGLVGDGRKPKPLPYLYVISFSKFSQHAFHLIDCLLNERSQQRCEEKLVVLRTVHHRTTSDIWHVLRRLRPLCAHKWMLLKLFCRSCLNVLAVLTLIGPAGFWCFRSLTSKHEDRSPPSQVLFIQTARRHLEILKMQSSSSISYNLLVLKVCWGQSAEWLGVSLAAPPSCTHGFGWIKPKTVTRATVLEICVQV